MTEDVNEPFITKPSDDIVITHALREEPTERSAQTESETRTIQVWLKQEAKKEDFVKVAFQLAGFGQSQSKVSVEDKDFGTLTLLRDGEPLTTKDGKPIEVEVPEAKSLQPLSLSLKWTGDSNTRPGIYLGQVIAILKNDADAENDADSFLVMDIRIELTGQAKPAAKSIPFVTRPKEVEISAAIVGPTIWSVETFQVWLRDPDPENLKQRTLCYQLAGLQPNPKAAVSGTFGKLALRGILEPADSTANCVTAVAPPEADAVALTLQLTWDRGNKLLAPGTYRGRVIATDTGSKGDRTYPVVDVIVKLE